MKKTTQNFWEKLQLNFQTHKFYYTLLSIGWASTTLIVFLSTFWLNVGASIGILITMTIVGILSSVTFYKVSTMDFSWNEAEDKDTGKLCVETDSSIQPPANYVLPITSPAETIISKDKNVQAQPIIEQPTISNTEIPTTKLKPDTISNVTELKQAVDSVEETSVDTKPSNKIDIGIQDQVEKTISSTESNKTDEVDIFGPTNTEPKTAPEQISTEEIKTTPAPQEGQKGLIDDGFDVFN